MLLLRVDESTVQDQTSDHVLLPTSVDWSKSAKMVACKKVGDASRRSCL
jgi:hypothetical protein